MRRRTISLLSVVALAAAGIAVTAPSTAGGLRKAQAGGAQVEIVRPGSLEACVDYRIARVEEDRRSIDVTVAATVKASAGACGCPSARVKARVFRSDKADITEADKKTLNGFKDVQTIDRLRNDATEFNLRLRKSGAHDRYFVAFGCSV